MSSLTQFQFLPNGVARGGRVEPTLGLLVRTNALTLNPSNPGGFYTVGPTTNLIRVRLTGGGGAGGGTNSIGTAGGGGGSGGYCEKLFNVTPNASYQFYVGAGGAGGTSNPANAGGVTSFAVTNVVPTTAAQTATVFGYGDFSGGSAWQFNEASGDPVALYGSISLFAFSSPTYLNVGARGANDYSVGLSAAASNFSSLSSSDLDVGATDDLLVAWIGQFTAVPTSFGAMFQKASAGFTTGWAITGTNGTGFLFEAGPSAPYSSSVASYLVGRWHIGIAAIDRSTNTLRMSLIALDDGTQFLGTTATIPAGTNLSNAANFAVGAGSWVGANTEFLCSELYVTKGSGVATGVPANMGTALTNMRAMIANATAAGGGGGVTTGGGAGAGAGGAGGYSFNGDVNIAGGPGDAATMLSGTVGVSGRGGSSLFGGGGNSKTAAGAANAGSGYGGGGGGVFGASSGGSGANGVIVVEEYAGGVAPANTGLTLVGVQTFNTTNGQPTYTPTPGTTAVLLQAVGGGGGGGGISGAGGVTAAGGAGGGNSGTYIEQWISGATITGGSVIIGAGGNAGSNTPTSGGAGSDTSIVINGVTYTAGGGAGGPGATTTTAILATLPAAQSRASSACTAVTWAYGGSGFGFNGSVTFSGCGGSSPFGAGGVGGGGGTIGGTGGTGAGGGGGCDWHGATGFAGGPGGDGQIIIYEFA